MPFPQQSSFYHPPRRKSNTGLIVAIVVGGVVLLLGLLILIGALSNSSQSAPRPVGAVLLDGTGAPAVHSGDGSSLTAG
jgi:hypothetical protein